MNDKISVIVPAYNAELYLNQCIDSILMQSYSNFELILVDDGSVDRTRDICNAYIEKDNRIQLICHDKNQGLASGKNDGIRVASGEYIAFVDADDYIEPDMLEHLVALARKTESDITVCNYRRVDGSKYKTFSGFDEAEIKILEGNEKYRLIYLDGIYGVVSWNKLWKKSLFDDIQFPIGKLHEDNYVIHRLLQKANKTCISGHCCYNYRVNINSIVASVNFKRISEDIQACRERLYFFQNEEPSNYYEQCEYENLLSRIIIVYCKLPNVSAEDRDAKHYLRELFRQEYVKADRSGLGFQSRLSQLLFYIWPWFGSVCRHCVKKLQGKI